MTKTPKPRARWEKIEEVLTSFYYEGALALKNNKLNENLKQLLPIRVKQIIEILSRREREVLEKMKKRVERIKLDMDVVVCDCGEPYRDSDPADLIDELFSDITKRLKR